MFPTSKEAHNAVCDYVDLYHNDGGQPSNIIVSVVPYAFEGDNLEAMIQRYNSIGMRVYAYSCFPGGIELYMRKHYVWSDYGWFYDKDTRPQTFKPTFVDDLEYEADD